MDKFTIIIPIYNEEDTLETFLEQLFQVIKRKDFEIIVVDDASTDKSLEIMKKFPVKIIKNP